MHLIKPRSMKLRRYRRTRNFTSSYWRNHGHHLSFHAHHMKKKDDCKRFHLRRFYWNKHFETRSPRKIRKISCRCPKIQGQESNNNKRRRADFNSSVVESSEKSSLEQRRVKEYCFLHGIGRYSTNKCKDLCTMVNNHLQNKKKNFQEIFNSW